MRARPSGSADHLAGRRDGTGGQRLGGEESLCPGRPVLGVPGEAVSGGLSLPANATVVAPDSAVKGRPELHGQPTGIRLARQVRRQAKPRPWPG